MEDNALDSARLLAVCGALANPHRLRIVARLQKQGQTHVSELARNVGLSRPLLYMHLQRLERAGLVEGELSLSPDGTARKNFRLTSWSFRISAAHIAQTLERDPLPHDKETPA